LRGATSPSNGCVFIKDVRNARMSGDADEVMTTEAGVGRTPGHVAVVSHMGEMRPDNEMLADMVSMFCVDKGMSVTSYVCVDGVSPELAFLASHAPSQTKHYMKQMVASTERLTRISADVLFLLSHGFRRQSKERTPSRLDFYGGMNVSVLGSRIEREEALEIWSCSSFTSYTDQKEPVTYEKPEHGVTLSQVVDWTKLVMLLCCRGREILQEYEYEKKSEDRPDFVLFDSKEQIYDISINVFLALLIYYIDADASKDVATHALVKRNVCRVIALVQYYTEQDNAVARFWQCLQDTRCVSVTENKFQIRWCIANFDLTDEEPKDVMRDLQSLALVMWHGGVDGGPGHIARLHCRSPRATLLDYIDPGRARPSQAGARASALRAGDEVELLLLQLKGLFSDRKL
jgi:hypothetical protein